MFAGYQPLVGSHDECLEPSGQVRSQYQSLVSEIEQLGDEEISRRREQMNRLVRENGTVYNPHGNPEAPARPWDLDLLPLIFEPYEWQSLSAALIQRAQFWDKVLADLYGPQTLLTDNVVPASLLFSHPAFVRAFHGQRHSDHYLHLYAVDLSRGVDGQWSVIADRTDAPMGMAYALENRIVLSRVFASVVRNCHVQRLASFFISLRDTLRNMARHRRDNPRIVLLSHGTAGPSYFEDAYLARYLGYTLVEGADLTVRDNHVLLKTLGGLLPVDVILRRMSDQLCDPLELRSDPLQGVPGLFNVARRGNVAVANAFGSSLVESPVWLAFLPQMADALLGEQLKLPSVPTWWCGQEPFPGNSADGDSALNLGSAYRIARMSLNRDLGGGSNGQTASMERVRTTPEMFVRQQRLNRSTVPVWNDRGVTSQHVAIRVFLVAHKNSYEVMPGGLVRVGTDPEELGLSVLAGQGSKDAWVCSDGPVPEVSLLKPPGKSVELRRSGTELPSRVADNLFWIGRNAERCEAAARLLRPLLVRLTGESDPAAIIELAPLLRALATQGQIEPGFVVEGLQKALPRLDTALPRSILDDQAGSLKSTVLALHHNASLVRDWISVDSWKVVQRIQQQVSSVSLKRHVELSELLEMTDVIVLELAAFSGLIGESMTRTQAWRFLELGRRLERSLHVAALVQNALIGPAPPSDDAMQAALEVAESTMTYRSRYLANLQLPMVLDLLLTDQTNPRSLCFQLIELAAHVENLPIDQTHPLGAPEQRITLAALNSIKLLDEDSLHQPSANLIATLEQIQEQLPKLAELISHRYLIHSTAPRQLARV